MRKADLQAIIRRQNSATSMGAAIISLLHFLLSEAWRNARPPALEAESWPEPDQLAGILNISIVTQNPEPIELSAWL